MIVPHKLTSLMLSLFIAICYSTSLQAQDSQAQHVQAQHVQNQQKITIAVGEWPPYISQDQKHNGVISHMISDIFADIGIDASIQFFPWARAYNDTVEGLHSATAIWMDKDERKIDFIYSKPVLVEQFVFFHNKALPFDWTSIDDLKNFAVGGVYASSYGPELDQALSAEKIKMERVNRPQQNFKKLLKNRIELFPFELHVGSSILKKHFTTEQQQQITHHPKPLLNNSSFVLFPKALASSEELSVKFNQQLKIIKDNGKYDTYFVKLKQGYYDKDIKP